jgi:hypothetical protein
VRVKISIALIAGLCALLAACDGGKAYRKEAGVWWFGKDVIMVAKGEHLTPLNGKFAKTEGHAFYRATPIPEADAPSFVALDEHYAKDKNQVVYCDTARSGQDYFTTTRVRIDKIPGADPASFTSLESGYGHDRARAYYEGVPFRVRDVASLTPLDNGFASDSRRGYYMRSEIADSDGPTFAVIDGHYSRDKSRVFYSFMSPGAANSPPTPMTSRVLGAQAISFSALGYDYAKDTVQAYYRDQALSRNVGSFEVLDFGYAKNREAVFYYGKPIEGADPASFIILDKVTDAATAHDRTGRYKDGVRVAPAEP